MTTKEDAGRKSRRVGSTTPARPARSRRPGLVTWLAAGLGAIYALLTVLADRGAWLAYSWSTDAGKVWGLVGDGLVRPALRGLQTLDLLATGDVFLALVYLPRALAADILQQVIGTIAHLAGVGADRYEALRAIAAALGPAGSLWLWLGVSLLAGAGLGLAVLGLVAAGRRLLRGPARRREGGGRPAAARGRPRP